MAPCAGTAGAAVGRPLQPNAPTTAEASAQGSPDAEAAVQPATKRQKLDPLLEPWLAADGPAAAADAR